MNMDGTFISETTNVRANPSVLKDLKKLLSDRHISPVFFKSLLMFTVSVNLAILTQYNVTHMEGNKFHNLMVVGLGLASGMVMSGVILQLFKIRDWVGYIVGLVFIIVLNMLQLLELPLWLMYTFFFIQVFSVGVCLNLQYIIYGTRMNPLLVATSLEICFCFANIIASTVPIIVSKPMPVPLMAYVLFCTLGISTVSSLGTTG